jgi:hypothetical protein
VETVGSNAIIFITETGISRELFLAAYKEEQWK